MTNKIKREYQNGVEVLTSADSVVDESTGKKQSVINAETVVEEGVVKHIDKGKEIPYSATTDTVKGHKLEYHKGLSANGDVIVDDNRCITGLIDIAEINKVSWYSGGDGKAESKLILYAEDMTKVTEQGFGYGELTLSDYPTAKYLRASFFLPKIEKSYLTDDQGNDLIDMSTAESEIINIYTKIRDTEKGQADTSVEILEDGSYVRKTANGKVIRTKNIDKNISTLTITAGYYVGKDGPVADKLRGYTDYIDISGVNTLKWSSGDTEANSKIVFYDDQKGYMTFFSWGKGSINIGSDAHGAKYVRMTVLLSGISDSYLRDDKDNDLLQYTTLDKRLISLYDAESRIVNLENRTGNVEENIRNNAATISKLKEICYSYNIEYIGGLYGGAVDTFTPNKDYGLTDYIDIHGLTTLAWDSGGRLPSARIFIYDEQKNKIGYASFGNGTFPLTNPEWVSGTAYYCRMSVNIPNIHTAFIRNGYNSEKIWSAEIDVNKPNLEEKLRILEFEKVQTLSEDVEKLKNSVPKEKTDIKSMYGDSKFKLKMQLMKLPFISWDETKSERPTTLLLFSDVHGDSEKLQRVIDFNKLYTDYIDDVIHTGDIVVHYVEDGFDFWKSVAGAERILNVIGNHDVWEKLTNKYTYSQQDSYNTYFVANTEKPFIANWGVNYENNKCYYYKDYPHLRLIVLDKYHDYDNGIQDTWLKEKLADAANKDLHVMIAVHQPPSSDILQIENNTFHALGFSQADTPEYSHWEMTEWLNIVDKFISGTLPNQTKTGVFISWISGHQHWDWFGTVQGHAEQTSLTIASARYKMIDAPVVNDNNLDCFEVLSFDTRQKQMRIVRVGCYLDRLFRKKEVMSYDYENRKIIQCY